MRGLAYIPQKGDISGRNAKKRGPYVLGRKTEKLHSANKISRIGVSN